MTFPRNINTLRGVGGGVALGRDFTDRTLPDAFADPMIGGLFSLVREGSAG
jgi:hypothetical protein